MVIFDLLKTEDKGAHYIDFGPFMDRTAFREMPEEQLYEFELARLAARQCREMLDRDLNEPLFEELSRSLSSYKGLNVPSILGRDVFFTARPQY